MPRASIAHRHGAARVPFPSARSQADLAAGNRHQTRVRQLSTTPLVVRGPSYFAQPVSHGLFVQGVTLRVTQSLLHLDIFFFCDVVEVQLSVEIAVRSDDTLHRSL